MCVLSLPGRFAPSPCSRLPKNQDLLAAQLRLCLVEMLNVIVCAY